jgi:glyoxylase I family protein
VNPGGANSQAHGEDGTQRGVGGAQRSPYTGAPYAHAGEKYRPTLPTYNLRPMTTTEAERRSTEFAARRQQWHARYLRPASERPQSTARGVHHMALICSDVERTIQFYQELLGFPLIELMENRDYKGSTHLFFDIGNNNLLAFFDFPGLGLQAGVESLGAVQHIAISTTPENLALIKSRLEAQGIAYLGPDRGVTTSIYFKDPDGIQIEMIAEPLLTMDGRGLGR